MITRMIAPFRRLGGGFADNDFVNIVHTAPLIKVGTLWTYEKSPDLSPNNVAVGVINGSAMTIYTVTAGKRPVLYSYTVKSSAAGLVSLRYNGVVIAQWEIVAGAFIVVSIEKGLVLPTDGGVFDVLNGTGGNANLTANLILSEYTP